MNQIETDATQQMRSEIMRRFSDLDFLTAAIGKATLEAVRRHKLAGNPIAAWQDGRVVIVQPEDIDLHEVDARVEA